MPPAAARSASSAMRRVLPTPASPPTSTTSGRPSAVAARAAVECRQLGGAAHEPAAHRADHLSPGSPGRIRHPPGPKYVIRPMCRLGSGRSVGGVPDPPREAPMKTLMAILAAVAVLAVAAPAGAMPIDDYRLDPVRLTLGHAPPVPSPPSRHGDVGRDRRRRARVRRRGRRRTAGARAAPAERLVTAVGADPGVYEALARRSHRADARPGRRRPRKPRPRRGGRGRRADADRRQPHRAGRHPAGHGHRGAARRARAPQRARGGRLERVRDGGGRRAARFRPRRLRRRDLPARADASCPT